MSIEDVVHRSTASLAEHLKEVQDQVRDVANVLMEHGMPEPSGIHRTESFSSSEKGAFEVRWQLATNCLPKTVQISCRMRVSINLQDNIVVKQVEFDGKGETDKYGISIVISAPDSKLSVKLAKSIYDDLVSAEYTKTEPEKIPEPAKVVSENPLEM